MQKFFLSILVFGVFQSGFAQQFTLNGYIREAGSGEQLIGVTIYAPKLKSGTTSNTYGFYSLTLPQDSLEVTFSYIGYRPQSYKLLLNKNTEFNISLQPENQQLTEIKVSAERSSDWVSEDVQMSVIEVPIRQIKDIPALLGEKDVLKVLQLMPGVQKGSEGNSGLYVRGGGPDQNLIILDDAIVYNAYHLFGFFSLFNGDALKSVELTKGGFPARYGGRLSSVIEMNMKEGNKEKLQGEAGIGLLSSRLTLEGPLVKGKSSFLISGRRTYIDALIYPFLPSDSKFGYNFYDLTTKVNYDFGRRNKLYLSGYFGNDKFFGRETNSQNDTYEAGLKWGNATATLRWNHLFNEKLFANTSFVFSNYRFVIFQKDKFNDSEFSLDYRSAIRDFTLKTDFDYIPSPKHYIRFGMQHIYHRFKPSALVVKDTDINELKTNVENIDALESGIYAEDTYKPFPNFTVNLGLRVSSFLNQKKLYVNPEPRISLAYRLLDDLAFKASFATMNQYVHLLSNTGVGLPTDLWVPTTRKIIPQQSQQVALGIAKDFTDKNFSVTLEGYYKKMNHVVGYKEGASFLLIDDPTSSEQVNWEDNITRGQGWSYGSELLIQRKFGKFSGWIGYTLSWTQLQFEELNFGRKYFARYDRRHDISVVGIYRISDRITLSGTWVYGTGNAITLPLAQYQAVEHNPGSVSNNNSYNYYQRYYTANDYGGTKNGFRMTAYHRFDLGIQFHKHKKNGERTWEISFYNAYNQKNPFYYFISTESENGVAKDVLKQVTLFPIIPSVSYSIKF